MKDFTMMNCWCDNISDFLKGNFLTSYLKLKNLMAFIFLLLSPFAFSQVVVQGTAPVNTPNFGMEIDGDARAATGDPLGGDWFFSQHPDPAQKYGALFKIEGGELVPVYSDIEGDLPRTILQLDDLALKGAIDGTIFTGTNKINDDPNTYTWGPGNVSPKDEMQNVAVHFTHGVDGNWTGEEPPTINDDIWCLFAADRAVTNGDSYIDFEFLQASLTMTGESSGGFVSDGEHGGRTLNDILISVAFSNGGAEPVVVVYEWQEVGTNTYQYVEINEGIEFYTTSNTSETEVPFPIYNVPQNPDGTYTYEINQWVEGAFNLTALFNALSDSCINLSTLFIRTRSSGESNNSELFDFPEGPIALDIDFTPDAPTAESVAACESWDAILTATCEEGIPRWYSDDNGEKGTFLFQGTSFEPGEITETTSFWVVCSIEGCEGDPTMVTVRIDDPVDAGEPGAMSYCSDVDLKNIDLFDLLEGTPDEGGVWTEGEDPASSPIDLSGYEPGVYTFTYTVTPEEGSKCEEASADVVVTIIGAPSLDPIDAVTACDSYDLPAVGEISGDNLYSPKYYDDSQENEGEVITDLTLIESQMVWVYDESGTDPNCFDEISFMVTINNTPDIDPIKDVLECDSYTLPDPSTLTGSNLVDPQYYDNSQENGGQLITEYTLTESQTVWVYDETDTDPNCFDEIEFDVVITDSPVADELDDQTACDEYILPELSAGNQYFTGTGGTGDELMAGDAITSTQDIYIYAAASEPCVADESMFTVTIYKSPQADDFSDVTMCDSYTLPALSEGSQYFSGPGATGTELFAGASITSTQTIYVYAEATDPCVADETSFVVTINDTPVLDPIGDVTECDEYTLPDPSLITGSNLVDPQYYDNSQSNGGQVITNLTLTMSQMVWVYDETGTDPNCFDEISFMVTIEECAQEGCTLGYWKNHTDRWCDQYDTCMTYAQAFYDGAYEDAPAELRDLTLLQVLNLGGGGIYNLGRQSVAALLNTCSSGMDDIDFYYSDVADLIDDVRMAIANGEAGSFAYQLDMWNQEGCPLGGSRATTEPSDGCSTASSSSFSADSASAAGFTVSPNPFKDVLNIQYNFNYTSDVVIEVFDISGNKVFKMKESGVSAGKMSNINADFVRGQQMYIIRVTTDRDKFEQKAVSGN